MMQMAKSLLQAHQYTCFMLEFTCLLIAVSYYVLCHEYFITFVRLAEYLVVAIYACCKFDLIRRRYVLKMLSLDFHFYAKHLGIAQSSGQKTEGTPYCNKPVNAMQAVSVMQAFYFTFQSCYHDGLATTIGTFEKSSKSSCSTGMSFFHISSYNPHHSITSNLLYLL